MPGQWCGFSVEAIQTNHPRKNHAYRISDGTTTFVWTGDCCYSEELAAFCAGSDVVICEASMKECNTENAIEWGHMTPKQFARLVNEASPKVAVTTHYTELEPDEFAEVLLPMLNEGIELCSAYDGFEFSYSA